MREIDAKKKRKFKVVKWVDSHSRFFAVVSKIQDQPDLVRLEISIPRIEKEDIFCTMKDNLFIPLHETIFLRPYQPYNAMSLINPSLFEVAVNVHNFWTENESGGNSGRVIRQGTVDVTGETDALKRLRGEKDKHFTKQQRFSRNGDASGVKGLEHVLQGGINIRRLRSSELRSTTEFSHRWVCVDYSDSHSFYCNSVPPCVQRSDTQDSSVNTACLYSKQLFLQRQHDNSEDENEIAVVFQMRGRVVGIVPRELSSCLAPCIDGGVITVQQQGVYSQVNGEDNTCHRVWFRIDTAMPGSGGLDEDILQKTLSAIPCWVLDESNDI
jgi:hypothetical protein